MQVEWTHETAWSHDWNEREGRKQQSFANKQARPTTSHRQAALGDARLAGDTQTVWVCIRGHVSGVHVGGTVYT
jgi:hypothetical protein